MPQWIHPPNGGLLTLAGLTARWEPGGGAEPVYSYTILTTDARTASFMQPVHERMPVIVALEDRGAWLDADTPVAELQALLRAAPEAALQRRGISSGPARPQRHRDRRGVAARVWPALACCFIWGLVIEHDLNTPVARESGARRSHEPPGSATYRCSMIEDDFHDAVDPAIEAVVHVRGLVQCRVVGDDLAGPGAPADDQVT